MATSLLVFTAWVQFWQFYIHLTNITPGDGGNIRELAISPATWILDVMKLTVTWADVFNRSMYLSMTSRFHFICLVFHCEIPLIGIQSLEILETDYLHILHTQYTLASAGGLAEGWPDVSLLLLLQVVRHQMSHNGYTLSVLSWFHIDIDTLIIYVAPPPILIDSLIIPCSCQSIWCMVPVCCFIMGRLSLKWLSSSFSQH